MRSTKNNFRPEDDETEGRPVVVLRLSIFRLLGIYSRG